MAGWASDKRVCVLGLGYIGLPTASVLATNGVTVLGYDVNPSVVETIARGQIHIEEPGLKTMVQAAIHSGKLRATRELEPCECFIIAVPTPITTDKKADLSYVRAAAEAVLPHLWPGALVILESTSPPGTTQDVLLPILEKSGLKVGVDLFVDHCPERVLPGRILTELIENPRVIGGITPACAEKARELYQVFVAGEMFLTDATSAELVKVMENTYRDVNIALANELAQLCERLKVSAWDVIRLANLHPRVHLHQPGPGVGGHCISVDPWFIVEQAPELARLIHQARLTNDSMPHHVAETISSMLVGITQPKVTVLGVSYKGNVDDTRESPSLEVIEALHGHGIQVGIYDPHVVRLEGSDLQTLEDAFRGSDLVVLLTAHNEYRYLSPDAVGRLMRRRMLYDTRNALPAKTWKDAGFEVYLLGTAQLAPCSVAPV